MRVHQQKLNRRSLALGTGPGVFTCHDHRLTIAFFGSWTFVDVELADQEQARRTCLRLRRALRRAQDRTSAALKHYYSADNLMAFLGRHLDPSKAKVVTFEAPLQHHGLEIACRMPDGRWADVGADDVVPISPHPHPHSNGALVAAALKNGTTRIDRSPKRDSRGRISIPPADFLKRHARLPRRR